MSERITYLGYYDTDNNVGEQRNIVRAATTKMDYIASKIEESGRTVDIVSMSGTSLKRRIPGHVYARANGGKLILFPSLGMGNPLRRLISRHAMESHMRHYLRQLGRGSVVVAYHSLGYADLLREEKNRVGFKLILEVEELYSDVTGKQRDAHIEQGVFDAADAFICSTELLSERFSPMRKPCVVCSGIYRMAEKRAEKQSDGKIHVVYAGTLDPRKGGAAAGAAAAFLNVNYHVHILGFGNSSEIEAIEKAVAKANEQSRGACITYDGYKSGVEFDDFIQSCHIGLSPQDPDAQFNATSFPSKVFMYLSHGLPVVSVDLPVFKNESLRSVLYLSEGNGPESLSEAIMSVDASGKANPENVMGELDIAFSLELADLLKEVADWQ